MTEAKAEKPSLRRRAYYIGGCLVVLGILAFGYSRGKEMLVYLRFQSAYITISRVWQATKEFEDTHHQLPGKLDTSMAACLLKTAQPCKNFSAVAAESAAFWNDLDTAGLLRKYGLPAPEKTTVQGKDVYYIRAAFGDLLVTTNTAKNRDGGIALVLVRQRVLMGMASPTDPQAQPLTPQEARGLDQMLDDAQPTRGKVKSYGISACTTADGHYNESLKEKACGLVISLPMPEKSAPAP